MLQFQDLYPAAAFINVNDAIWSMYFNELLPLLAKDGDDGNYAVTVDADLACLQVHKQCHTACSLIHSHHKRIIR